MGISRAQLDLAGKNAFLADGDLCPLDGGQLNFPEQGGVVADLDAVVVALDVKQAWVQETRSPRRMVLWLP